VRATKLNAIGTTFVICLCCLIVLWARKRNVAGDEYARLNTGANITRGNSENGALPTRESEQGENKSNTGQITDLRASRRLSRDDRLGMLGRVE
jgi:hypothetical protein